MKLRTKKRIKKQKQMNFQLKVAEFQKQHGQEIDLTIKRSLTESEHNLRESLLLEELQELEDAIATNNNVEILDALCDLKYINDGTANMIGAIQDDELYEDTYFMGKKWNSLYRFIKIKRNRIEFVDKINMHIYSLANSFDITLENFKIALDRVHQSNMSKFCKTESEAKETVGDYVQKGIEAFYFFNNDAFVILRESDKKVLKSKYYKKVELSDLV